MYPAQTWMCFLQFVSPYMCCPKCLIIHPTKPLIFCPCNHFLAELAQGFFATQAKWGSVITRLRIQDSNRRKGRCGMRRIQDAELLAEKALGKTGLLLLQLLGWGSAGGRSASSSCWATCPLFSWGQEKPRLFRAFPARLSHALA